MSRRTDRIARLIQREISRIITEEVADPRFEFVTIVNVKLSIDLRNATVFFSKLGHKDETTNTYKALVKAEAFIQQLVAQRLNLRYTPMIHFKYDKTLLKAQSIENLLDNLADNKEANENETSSFTISDNETDKGESENEAL